MTKQFKNSIARFFLMTEQNIVVGMGFLVTKKHVLTCAHVVNGALGILDDSSDQPTEKIALDFPFIAPNQIFFAKVIIWYSVSDDSLSDIAFLELLDNGLPTGCEPVRLLTSEVFGHLFQAYGFPTGYDNKGIFTEGKIVAELADGTIQIQGDSHSTGCEIVPGFSGSPVWDEQKLGIVGMIVAADNRPDNSLAFFIPTNILVKAWPELNQYCPKDTLPLQPRKKIFFLQLHLPNRVPQERKLRQAIQAHQDKQFPLLCVVHGDDNQCNDTFLTRLIKKYLPKIGDEYNQIKEYRLNLRDIPNTVEESNEEFLNRLGESVLDNVSALRQQIIEEIARQKIQCPVIIHASLYSDDGFNAINNVIRFWGNWSFPQAPSYLLLIYVTFNYQKNKRPTFLERLRLKKSVNDTIKDKIKPLENNNLLDKFGVNGVVLPELHNIKEEHVQEWANDFGHEFRDVLQPEISTLFEASFNEGMTMSDLAKRLEDILTKLGCQIIKEIMS